MSGSARVKEMRKKLRLLEGVDPEKMAETNDQTKKMLLGLAGRIYSLERKLNALFPVAKKADWRSLALVKVMADRSMVQEQEVVDMAERLQKEFFEKESDREDQQKGLVPSDTDVAEDGMFVITSLRVFKDGKELEDERIVRSKIELGVYELFPELDDAIRGMRIGESKRFPLNLQQQTDEAEVTLIGLRKRISVQSGDIPKQ